MIVNWLVFADLHFKSGEVKSKIIRESLLKYLGELDPDGNYPLDFILIAGDCFFKYDKEKDIKPTEDFIHAIISASIGGVREKVYITPGNHDLYRTALRLRNLSYYTGINYETGIKEKEIHDIDDDARNMLFSDQFFSGFFELYRNITGKDYKGVHQLIELDNYRILNINTCLLAGGYYTGTDENKKDLHLDEGNLSVLDEDLVGKLGSIPKDDKVNIVLMHHGIKYLRESERETFQKILEDSNIDLVFTGHSHKIGIESYNYVKRDLREFTCGAIIGDNYSEPSFFRCTFDTDTKEFRCELHGFAKENKCWRLDIDTNNRKFEKGVFTCVLDRFSDKIPDRAEKKEILKSKKTIVDTSKNHFSMFGIIDALPMREFIALRNKLIQEAVGDIVLAGQSLENAFDIRKDSESLVESIKRNKKIGNIDIFLTDPIMYDSSTDTYEGDTPISRIDSTMHTILSDIALSLDENQSINIYFIPLVQLDHMVFVNDVLLLRHTLLWTNNNHYKATPLVCKNIDSMGVSEAIVKSSMYNVYAEYVNKLKEESIVIDIQEHGYERSHETLAKIKHKAWRHRLFQLRQSGKLKGSITMHKLYRTQLISDLHSSWDSRFRSFSSEINWTDESETSSFYAGNKTQITSHNELYLPEKLLNDSTQKIILPYVQETERLLNGLVKKYDNEAFAKIYPSLDIGVPNNILRLAGGFATGMLVVWKCGTPIVPVDTTVNVCSSSYYEFDPISLHGISIKEFFNENKINEIINKGSKSEGLAFSFNTGNHFLLLCKGKKNGMFYLVLHSSAKQFKDTFLGLYPKPHNWYSGYVKTYEDKSSNRYIRYLKDNEAKQFIAIARMLNRENEDIHNWFATQFCGDIRFTKKKTYHHYGMPTDYSIAIGTYVIDQEDVVPIFSREDYPIWLFRPDKGMWSIELEGKSKFIVPHGWGQHIRYDFFDGLKNEDELKDCSFEISKGHLNLVDGLGRVLKEFDTDYSKRFPEKMVEVRKLWDKSEEDSMLRYKHYLSGKIEEILEPVALFSKNHEGVKYYTNGE